MATEKQLFEATRSALIAGFARLGISGLQVKQAWQPTQQGTPTDPAIFLTLVSHNRYGYPSRTSRFDEDEQKEYFTETQVYQTMFQINALAAQNPADTQQLTAGDLVNSAAYIMQSDATLTTFRAAGFGLERVTQVRNPKFQDDRDRFEASPSFDFVMTHKQIVTTEIDVLQSTELQIFDV